ncbi:cytoplasmic protein, partial [Bacillus pseudomycoides]
MDEFKKNPIATEEDFFRLSDKVYDNNYLYKGETIQGINGNTWKVIES